MVMDRAQLEIDRLDRAERPLDLSEALVGEHGVFGAERVGRDTGADHVDPVKRRLLRDRRLVSFVVETIFRDRELEVLAHLEAAEHAPDAQADAVFAP